MKQPHPTQLGVLKKLMFAKSLRYTELKPISDLENNTFDFHIDQLIQQGFIIKKDSLYYLTNAGKEYAGHIDTEKTIITRQAKVSVLIYCERVINDKLHFLVYTRLKQPFYGTQGLISGKVGWGEKIVEAGERELFEEAGLSGTAQIAIMRHYMVMSKATKEMLEDKIMFFCIFKNPTGTIVPSEEGKYEWVAEDQMEKYMTNPVEEKWRERFESLKNYTGAQLIEEFEHLTTNFKRHLYQAK